MEMWLVSRARFNARFDIRGPVALPVVLVIDVAQSVANLRIAIDEGTHGCVLIIHDFPVGQFLPIVRTCGQKLDGRMANINEWWGFR